MQILDAIAEGVRRMYLQTMTTTFYSQCNGKCYKDDLTNPGAYDKWLGSAEESLASDELAIAKTKISNSANSNRLTCKESMQN